MPTNRRKISGPDRRFIIGRSGGRCNNCRRELFVENEFGEKARLGDDAHIVACSEFGPRGNASVSAKARASSQNLILLCKICHSKADQQPEEYSEARLLQIREEHYAWVEFCLGEKITKRPRFHYLSYINIPRVDMYAVVNSIALPSLPCSLESASAIRDLGFNAGRLMAAYTGVLNHEEFYANEFSDDTVIENLCVGSYWFSRQANFRSRKVFEQSDLLGAWDRLESVIYRKFNGWRLFCLIDPRWITTSTAYSTLRSGTFQTMALVHINKIDTANSIAIASPLFLGAQDNSIFS